MSYKNSIFIPVNKSISIFSTRTCSAELLVVVIVAIFDVLYSSFAPRCMNAFVSLFIFSRLCFQTERRPTAQNLYGNENYRLAIALMLLRQKENNTVTILSVHSGIAYEQIIRKL